MRMGLIWKVQLHLIVSALLLTQLAAQSTNNSLQSKRIKALMMIQTEFLECGVEMLLATTSQRC